MFYKYVMRNRSLKDWAVGATLLQASGCGIASTVLSIVAAGLGAFA
jgi:hypothetical protein